MKRTNSPYAFLFILIACGCLQACDPNMPKEYRPIFKTPFPQELFLSYFAGMNEGDSLLYVTHDTLDKDTFILYVQSARTSFEPYGEYPGILYEVGAVTESAGIERFEHEVTLSEDERSNYYLILSASCSQRQHLYFSCFDYHSNGYLDVAKDQPTNEIFALLTDTLPLMAKEDTTAILVRHKGLAWFKDEGGREWHLN